MVGVGASCAGPPDTAGTCRQFQPSPWSRSSSAQASPGTTGRPPSGPTVKPPDRPLVLSLFSGIGGLDLGFERAGFEVGAFVERDPFCREVLAKHWPGVPIHDDVTTLDKGKISELARGRRFDVVAGGFPCQPVSLAGRRMAQADERWLWPYMARTVDLVRPDWVVAENVPGLLSAGLLAVLEDLEGLGYQTRVGQLSACALGAPHTRSRVFIVSHPNGERGCPWRSDADWSHKQDDVAGEDGSEAFDQPERRSWWASEPGVPRVARRVPRGVDRRRALGNAVSPLVAEYIGRLINPL